ncbi:hypothetical protein ACOME3_001899 [Neoechinorhynchus agilis]
MSSNGLNFSGCPGGCEEWAELVADSDYQPSNGIVHMDRIFVKNLPADVDISEIREAFQEFGHVTLFKTITNRDGSPRGFGFVYFQDKASVPRVLAQNEPVCVRGRKLLVNVAIQRGPYRKSHSTAFSPCAGNCKEFQNMLMSAMKQNGFFSSEDKENDRTQQIVTNTVFSPMNNSQGWPHSMPFGVQPLLTTPFNQSSQQQSMIYPNSPSYVCYGNTWMVLRDGTVWFVPMPQ